MKLITVALHLEGESWLLVDIVGCWWIGNLMYLPPLLRSYFNLLPLLLVQMAKFDWRSIMTSSLLAWVYSNSTFNIFPFLWQIFRDPTKAIFVASYLISLCFRDAVPSLWQWSSTCSDGHRPWQRPSPPVPPPWPWLPPQLPCPPRHQKLLARTIQRSARMTCLRRSRANSWMKLIKSHVSNAAELVTSFQALQNMNIWQTPKFHSNSTFPHLFWNQQCLRGLWLPLL